MPLLKPIPPDFPKLPDKLRQIIGPEASRSFEKTMEEHRIEGAISTEKYVKDQVFSDAMKKFILDAIIAAGTIPTEVIEAYFKGGEFAKFVERLICGVTCDGGGAPTSGAFRVNLECLEPGVNGHCSCELRRYTEKAMSGYRTVLYRARYRFRGVIEPAGYEGGKNDGEWFQTGGKVVDQGGGFNVYSLNVSDPPQTYYLNRGHQNKTGVYKVDYEASITARGGALLTLSGTSIDKNQFANETMLVVPDIPPAPDWFNGQFLQADQLTHEPLPA